MVKANLKNYKTDNWEKLGGPKKVSMKVHQYEHDHLQKIVALGTCPLARGAIAPTARVASYLTSGRA